MGLFGKTEEEQAAAGAAKAEKQAERGAAAFRRSPAGQARSAYEQGDRLFQVDFEVMKQSAEIVAMMGSYNTAHANDPTAVLNAIAAEGWDLITASFVFIVQGEQSETSSCRQARMWPSRDPRLVTTSSDEQSKTAWTSRRPSK
jgi:hypothetical protein